LGWCPEYTLFLIEGCFHIKTLKYASSPPYNINLSVLGDISEDFISLLNQPRTRDHLAMRSPMFGLYHGPHPKNKQAPLIMGGAYLSRVVAAG
jgi:hypothetical protein